MVRLCMCAAMQHVAAVATHINALLQGVTDLDPQQHGMTTEEERIASSCPQVLPFCPAHLNVPLTHDGCRMESSQTSW